MICPECGTAHTRVLETRTSENKCLIRRRHECGNNHRFNTLEVHEAVMRRVGKSIFTYAVSKAAESIARNAKGFALDRKAYNLIKSGMAYRAIGALLGQSCSWVVAANRRQKKVNGE